jgi:hypothetical protein
MHTYLRIFQAFFVGLAAAWPGLTGCQVPVPHQVPPLLAGMPAPELDTAGEWLGVDRRLQLKDLRGKFVILEFWTYC